MANGRNPKRRGVDSSRDPGGFIALPWSVLDSPAYALLSHPAKSLLLEVARQYHKDDNGRMLLSRAYMMKRGWKSADTLTNAKRQLLELGFIYQTVMGHRPNKASWYAITWYSIDRIPGFDEGAAAGFVRGAYQKNSLHKNTSLKPSNGTVISLIAPLVGTLKSLIEPASGTIKAGLSVSVVPPNGNPLDMPSVSTELRRVHN
jgi:hypothetical protein